MLDKQFMRGLNITPNTLKHKGTILNKEDEPAIIGSDNKEEFQEMLKDAIFQHEMDIKDFIYFRGQTVWCQFDIRIEVNYKVKL